MRAPVYIGKSENLHRRFKEHVYERSHVGNYVRELPRLRYYYCIVDKKELSEVEGQLIHIFGPRVNRNQPVVLRATIGTPIKI